MPIQAPNTFSMTLRSHARNNNQVTGEENSQDNASAQAPTEEASLRAPRGNKRANMGDINDNNPKRARLSTSETRGLTQSTANGMTSPHNNADKARALAHLNTQREHYSQAAIETVKPSSNAERQALMDCVDRCFIPSNRPGTIKIDRQLFPQNNWQKPKRINENTAVFCNKLAENIASVSNTHLQNLPHNATPSNSQTEQATEGVIRDAVAKTFEDLGDTFTLDAPLSFFVFDTETNRLFGDVLSMGWVRLDVSSKTDIQVECRNCILPPNFVAYGAERIHKMSPDWIKSQHAQGHTSSPETTAKRWLEHIISSQSAIGFNLLYDLNAIKKLFHTAGVDRDKVDALLQEIGSKVSIDAQDFLLRVDPATRHDHHLPFANTKAAEKFAEAEFDNQYNDGTPITFLPNRKLVSYAQGFLGMETAGAHDALYDCVMTLGTYAKTLGLRNEVLAHEREFTRQSDKRLTTYNRSITPSETLSRRINAPTSDKAQDRPIYLQADSPSLIQNPALKSSPFIYTPTGPTVHRRHIIPKSTLASLLLPNSPPNRADNADRTNTAGMNTSLTDEPLTDTNKLYKTLLSHPKFTSAAQERLSNNAQRICQGFKIANVSWGEFDDPDLVNAVSEFIKGIEAAQDKDINIRYFERAPAKQFIEGLPASGDIIGSGTVDPSTMHKVMGAVLYSFYHSLEFNQFIGSGAENVVAGRLFHGLEQIETPALAAINSARTPDELQKHFINWLGQIQNILKPGAGDTSPEDVETQVLALATNPSQKVSGDTVLYFLEMQNAIHGFLSTFINFDFPEPARGAPATPVQTDSLNDALTLKSDTLQKLALLQAIVQHRETANRATFSDANWMNSLKIQASRLENATTKSAIDQSLTELTQGLHEARNALSSADLYEGDKALLDAFVLNLFANRTVKPELINFTATPSDPRPGITQFSAPKNSANTNSAVTNSLNDLKASIGSFIKAIKDNTAYDLPSNASRALQNSYLLPLYQQANQASGLTQSDKVAFFNGLLEADTDIAERLGVTRALQAQQPLYGNYMPYLN